MCICVNCQWVDRCRAYHSVERQHGARHLNENPDLTPLKPKIYVSVLTLENGTEIEWDVRGCKSFLEDNGRWQRLRPGEEVPA